MLKNILGLRERRIDDVMVPRAHIIAVQQDIPLGELVKVFEKAGHSRLVAFNDTLDDPVGMIHIRDLIAFMTARAAVSPANNGRRKKPRPAGLDLGAIDLSMPLIETKIIRPILFVPPSMPAIDLLAKMQATRIHLALVVDEYGGTDGIVSIEDLVELIVGDIEDEHDEEEAPGILRQPDGSFVADARASLEDVIEAVGKGFDVGDALNNAEITLAGYLVSQVGRVPVRGELVPGPSGFEFEVLDADPRRSRRSGFTEARASPSERPRELPHLRRQNLPRRLPPHRIKVPARVRSNREHKGHCQRRRPVLGLAPRCNRLRRWCPVGARARPLRFVANPFPDLSGRGLADRRIGGGPP